MAKRKTQQAVRPIAAVTADTHISRRNSAWASSKILGDAKYSFEQIVDDALAKGIPIIGAGDIKDEKLTDAGPVKFLAAMGRKLFKAGLKFYFVQGNHDYCEPPWLSSIHRAYVHLGHEGVKLAEGIHICGVDYTAEGELQQKLKAIGTAVQPDVLVCHQGWKSFGVGTAQGDFGDVIGVKVLITGDLHQSILRHEQHDRLLVYSPGATCQQAIDEPSDCSYGYLMSDLTIQLVPLKTRPLVRAERLLTLAKVTDAAASLPETLAAKAQEAADAGLPQNLHKPLLQIEYPESLRTEVQVIKRKVKDLCHLFEKELAPGLEEDDQDDEEVLTAFKGPATLLGALEAKEGVSPRAKELLTSILGSPKDGEVQALKKWVAKERSGNGRPV